MEYKSSNEFIPKLYTDNFMLGSFDVYLDKSKELIEKHIGSIPGILEDMPTSLRASVVSKIDNSYLGFISVVDMNPEDNYTSLILVLKDYLDEDKVDEIVNSYKEFLYNDLGIADIKDYLLINGNVTTEECHDVISSEVLLTASCLREGIDEKEKEKLVEEGYTIPNLQMPCTIKDGISSVGLVGLTNLIWSNRRANLFVFVDKDKDESFIRDVIPGVVNEYLEYVHNRSLYNVSMSISGSDINMMNTILSSNMNFYASLPYASSYKGNVESKYLFQSYPGMKKENGLYLPENKIIVGDNTVNHDFKSIIDLGNGYIAMSPKVFEENGIDINKIVNSHIQAMQYRDKFTIPLGEDKYIIQEGNGKYGISRAINNYTYIMLDKDMNYVGFTSILKEDALNAEIEMALRPECQSKGIGSAMRKKLYEELFRNGYMCVTSAVFDFNNKSTGLNEKFAKFSGKRIGAYYINGKLWDMNYYTKLNESEESLAKLR
jgi:GNAT superfamily N-acetyltransferase